jgi:hypothetical protein
MSAALSIDDIARSGIPLLGRTEGDPELRHFLQAIGSWPIPDFPKDEFNSAFEDKARGFALTFQDSSSIPRPAFKELPPGTKVFIGMFFFSEGKDGYSAFEGALPSKIVLSDTSEAVVAKLGPPRVTSSHDSGAVKAQRWPIEGGKLTASYSSAGALEHVYIGLF